jgi:transcription initiation factor TFIIIB Brf1 subunit/transcription initiation factor TFIIB
MQVPQAFVEAIKNQAPRDRCSHLSPIANNEGVSEKSLRKAVHMMFVIKENPISYGKDPNALAVAVLYVHSVTYGKDPNALAVAVL